MAQKSCLRPGELNAAIAGISQPDAVDQQAVELEGQTPIVLLQAARTRAKLGESSRAAGDLAAAAEHLEKAAEYGEQVLAAGEPTPDVLETISWCWLNLGRLHLDQGDPDAAAEHFDKAFALGQELHKRQRRRPRVLQEVMKSYGRLASPTVTPVMRPPPPSTSRRRASTARGAEHGWRLVALSGTGDKLSRRVLHKGGTCAPCRAAWEP